MTNTLQYILHGEHRTSMGTFNKLQHFPWSWIVLSCQGQILTAWWYWTLLAQFECAHDSWLPGETGHVSGLNLWQDFLLHCYMWLLDWTPGFCCPGTSLSPDNIVPGFHDFHLYPHVRGLAERSFQHWAFQSTPHHSEPEAPAQVVSSAQVYPADCHLPELLSLVDIQPGVMLDQPPSEGSTICFWYQLANNQ